MVEKVETDIDTLRNEQGEFLVTGDFKAKFYRFIADHYLPIPGESPSRARASGKLASGESQTTKEQAGGELEWKKEKKNLAAKPDAKIL